MKTKLPYLILILTTLLFACVPNSAALNQSAAVPAAQSSDNSTAVTSNPPSTSQDPQGQGQPSGVHLPPKEAFDACVGKTAQQSCSFTAQKGPESGTCVTVQDQLACWSQHGSKDGNGDQQVATPQSSDQQAAAQPGAVQPNNRKSGTQPDANGSAYNIEQAVSDKAQGMTISYDALAFMTGDLGADSFFPPGKVADFFGFQYLRDNDPSHMGHAGEFLTSAAMNMLNTLTTDQRAQLVALAKSQVDSIRDYAYKRFVLMQAFQNLRDGKLPSGTTGLSEEAVKAYSAQLYQLDGQLSFGRAQLYGKILGSLTSSQKASLDAMVGKGMSAWPKVDQPSDLKGLTPDVQVAVMTYASDMFSWYAGSVDADVYFCPERHGTYFGSFYLKDIHAMSDPTYAIPTSLTGDMGEKMLTMLKADQAQLITGLVAADKTSLQGVVDTRRQVSTELRKFIGGGTADESTVNNLMGQYGAYDGEMIYNMAVNFSKVSQSLTADQKTQLTSLRQQMLGSLTVPTGAYLYSQPIAMPQISGSDSLFK